MSFFLYYDLLLLSSLFHFFYFIFSAPISVSLCFPISRFLLLFDGLSQAFIKCSRKAFACIYVNSMYSVYIYNFFRKLKNFCLTKIFDIFIPLV